VCKDQITWEEQKIRTCVVLSGDVVGQVVIQNQAKQSIEKGQIDLFIDLRKNGLHKHVAFALASLPDIGQIIDALAPLRRQTKVKKRPQSAE